MSRQVFAVAEKIVLTPANIVKGVPAKTAAGELAVKASPYGKLGFRNIWPPEYSKPPNPRMMPFPFTFTARFRAFPWQFYWEYVPTFRMFTYGFLTTGVIFWWVDRNIMEVPENKDAMLAMVYDDLKEQRRVLMYHDQKHHDHAYFREKGCHDGHPHGFGVTDPHVL